MKIPVILNGEIIVLEAEPSMSLLEVLRREGVISAKLGCSQGRCGSCTVLLDGRAVPSCIIPLAAARDATIVTLEQFSKTRECQLIVDSFARAGIRLCGFCNAGKILGTYSLISAYQRPSHQMVCDMARHFDCGCTEQDSLVQGIVYAVAAFQNQAHSRQEQEHKSNRNGRNGRKGKN